ncbi:hypothetical protein HFC70_13695 [Agrobacterium sp. a22-2]|uniref:hypothetical protein n=1 Tax=Agrobacterium sp. a22-2 TaxID=2283840 RepID=UPI0014485B5A|nr:hypothetical protein [Agrobacterium sp. a22-2]NKN37406.1 hypothetical protein [Agrobacterium sp. a22-2]
MPDKTKKIYHALVEGAQAGLTDKALYQHVVEECHKATSKKIVKASLLALSDPDLNDSNILHTIYALAIKHRLDPSSMDDVDEPETVAIEAPKKGKRSTKKTVGDQVSVS